jgi:tetratricopeptide (TPR) repeat protein
VATLRETIERARKALIDGHADAALTPCQDVLARYPKHVEASCLLAETRREMRQLPQAADLFERVVAADPESLIGHWGLATILEERGDLEGALYELQVAWDVSPGQPAVADELRRLRAARGWEAQPVELSAAGLARAYWRGHQYRRALTEARRAVAKSPERLDLSLLECEALWRLGRVGEAAEVAAEILLDAPDCLKANLIRGYARVEAGQRGAEEGRKLLNRALALDPECLVAASLFPDRPLPAPLFGGEVDLEAEAPTVAVVEVEVARTRGSILAVVVPEADATGSLLPRGEGQDETVARGQRRGSRPHPGPRPGGDGTHPEQGAAHESLLPLGEGQSEDVAPGPSALAETPPSEDALTLAPSHDEREPEPEPVAELSRPEAVISAPEPEPEPVPQWLAKKPTSNAPVGADGLDPELYAEWADLLGEEVTLDSDAVARLEAALAEATGGSTTTGPWREVRLDGSALAQDDAPASAEAAPTAGASSSSTQPQTEEADLPRALGYARSTAATGDLDAAGEAYRQLLRVHAEAARDLIDELCRLVDAAPDHGGLRRALGDAYMRSGRFQKAIEEYNRAAASRQPTAVA